MWRPAEVVPQHKRRAVALWAVLIGGIIVYSSYLLYNALKKREYPGTAFEVSNEVYAYPDVWVCVYEDYGCDEMEVEEECLRSANATEGGMTGAVFYPGGEYEQEITAVPRLTPNNGWCVEFETSKITAFLGQEREASRYLDYLLLDMHWYPGGLTNDSKTCVEEGWESHREWMYIFLNDPDTGVVSTGIQVPYSCVTSTSDGRPFTYVGIGATREERLGEDVIVRYKGLTTATATFKDKPNPDLEKPYAHLALQIQQEPNSYENIIEIDPLDLAEMFGNVGGFWDLLMILWPIFFVAASHQDPHLKPRNFKKTVAKGIGGIRIGDRSGGKSVGAKMPAGSTATETRPHWDRHGEAGAISSKTIGVEESTSSNQADWVKRGDEAGAIGGKAIETTAPDSTTTSEDPRRPEPVDEEAGVIDANTIETKTLDESTTTTDDPHPAEPVGEAGAIGGRAIETKIPDDSTAPEEEHHSGPGEEVPPSGEKVGAVDAEAAETETPDEITATEESHRPEREDEPA